MVGGYFILGVWEGFSEEVSFELRPEGGGPSHVKELEGEHQEAETASAKVLGLIVSSSLRIMVIMNTMSLRLGSRE